MIEEAQKKIERHYVKDQMQTLEYDKKVRANETIKKCYDKNLEAYNKKKEKYITLQNAISTETLGAEEFNKKLEMFLGYGDIKLAFSKDDKGYKIIRDDGERARNLSEGEKTAVAFIYFITKLKESGKDIKDYILVIDDPISSFDSNKIFSAYAYLKAECDEAEQLFILTHNYNFFSLILGWFNRKQKKCDDKKMPDYALYRIENRIENEKRWAFLCDGGESMKQATEYDYVFYTVYNMKNKPLSKEESIFCGNVCRKLVESFLSFKFPKQRADLAALLLAALPGKENNVKRERIYKFINIYSHDKRINALEELDTDILYANSESVINDILEMIKELDENHFKAMVDKVSGELA